MRLAILLLALSTFPAFAAKQHDEPPARYVNAYKGTVSEIIVERGQAYKTCNRLMPSPGNYLGQLGCAIFGEGTEAPEICVIVWTRGKPHVRRHELAHCAGWRHD